MATKCEKTGCDWKAVNQLRFTHYVGDLDSEYPVALCVEHTDEVKVFAETDVIGVKEWLTQRDK